MPCSISFCPLFIKAVLIIGDNLHFGPWWFCLNIDYPVFILIVSQQIPPLEFGEIFPFNPMYRFYIYIYIICIFHPKHFILFSQSSLWRVSYLISCPEIEGLVLRAHEGRTLHQCVSLPWTLGSVSLFYFRRGKPTRKHVEHPWENPFEINRVSAKSILQKKYFSIGNQKNATSILEYVDVVYSSFEATIVNDIFF